MLGIGDTGGTGGSISGDVGLGSSTGAGLGSGEVSGFKTVIIWGVLKNNRKLCAKGMPAQINY